MARLLVSVRSVTEAHSALKGGASVIDLKEPDRGPLGRADYQVWAEVRSALPAEVPVSVALGELLEWESLPRREVAPSRFAGLAYRKLGLAGSEVGWVEAWATLRRAWGPGPSWVAVAYADWSRARAPHPDLVLDVALATPDCLGVLLDTWGKDRPSPVEPSWESWFHRARLGGRLTALAGGLDVADIARLAPLAPDLFAVRGSACLRGDRHAAIDTGRVARLADAVRRVG